MPGLLERRIRHKIIATANTAFGPRPAGRTTDSIDGIGRLIGAGKTSKAAQGWHILPIKPALVVPQGQEPPSVSRPEEPRHLLKGTFAPVMAGSHISQALPSGV